MKTVMIVEDDPTLAEILDEKLRENGFKTLVDHTVVGTNFKLGNQRFDCIVMDINLKTGSALDILPHVRATSGHLNQKTPVILMSGMLDEQVVSKLRSMTSSILVKPFPMEELIARVRRFSETPAKSLPV